MCSSERPEDVKVLWWLNHYAVPPDLPGGTRHYEIAKLLTREGFISYVFTSNYSHFSFEYVREEGLQRVREGVTFIWVKTMRYPRSSNLLRLFNMLSYSLRVKRLAMSYLKRGEVKSPDVVIGSTVHPFAALAGYQLARRLRKPFIYEIRDLWPQALLESGKLSESSPGYWALHKLNELLVRKSDAIVVLSQETKDFLVQELECPPDKITLLPNYIDYDEAMEEMRKTPLPSELAELLSEWRGQFLVCYAGSLSFLHASDLLIEVARRLPEDVKLALIGDGTMREKLERMIRDRKLRNVRLLGPYPRKVIWRALKEFHVLMVLDRNQPWGSSNKLADYLLAEKPIVFVTSSQQNFIEGLGLKASLDPDDLAGKLNYLRTSYDKFNKRVKELAPTMRRRLDLKAHLKPFADKVRELITPHEGRVRELREGIA